MFIFKIVRKIGKMLRGGAGKKEIFLGALCGVLIGFNPVAGLTLILAILITLLLNANIGFTLLGVALGKLLSLILAPISFQIGYFLIHNIGLEGLFTKLANAPVTALMDLNVYAMIGGLPFAIVIGLLFGKFISETVNKIREQMVKAGNHDQVEKVTGNKFSKFLMWLVFGKQKISTADVLTKTSPILRKSGLILIGSVILIGLVLQFFLLDLCLKKSLQSAISSETGAEVNIAKANLSLAGGKLEIEGLQIADPDKLTHNLIQLDTLAADISIGDLLRSTYTIDLLAGSILQRDVPRKNRGKLLVKKEKKQDSTQTDAAQDDTEGKSLDTYFAKAGEWKKYGEKAYDYLKKRKENGEAIAKGEKPQASKKTALADAKNLGYLKAAADLVSDRPAWTIRQITIDNVLLSDELPPQLFQGLDMSSHPELNGQPTTFIMTPLGETEPFAKIVLHFEDPAAPHKLTANLKNIEIGDAFKTGGSLNIESGKADLSASGTFSTDTLDIPFILLVRDLKTDNSTLNNLPKLELPGKLYGTLISPRVKVELSDQLKNAVVDAAKEKVKDEAKKAATKELEKAMERDDVKEAKTKASNALKKLF